MARQRIMIFGAQGQIGQAFQHVWNSAPRKPDWELLLLGRQECDITDPSALRDTIQTAAPDLVINNAAMTNVDEAEKNELLATKVNFHAAAGMAAQCSSLDVPMIQISTDYVFDGTKGAPYLTDDQMNPINTYGASKMMGEEAVRHELAWHVILRLSSVISAFSRNILTNTIKMLDDKDEIKMVTDIIAGPTPATHVVRALIVIGQQILNGKTDGFGTFHLCGTPACSRYELTQAIMAAHAPYSKRQTKLIPTDSSAFITPARRPLNTVLDCAKIKEVYGIDQLPFQKGIEESMNILFSGERPKL